MAGCNTSSAGRVEVFRDGRWGTIDGKGWSLREANVACREAGYPAGATSYGTSDEYGLGEGLIWYRNIKCRGSESSLQQCILPLWIRWRFYPDGSTRRSSVASVVCNESSGSYFRISM